MAGFRTLFAFAAFVVVGVVVSAPIGSANATGYQISVVAGAGGQVTTLQCYDPAATRTHPNVANKPDPFSPCHTNDDNNDGIFGDAHPGVRPVDIGATGSVYMQLDYLPNRDRGGYAYAEDISGACGAYVGQTIAIYMYHVDPTDTSSETYAMHSVQYQHVDMTAALNTWMHWNNADSSIPLWVSWVEQFKLSNTTVGGWHLGSMASLAPGTPPTCATGIHLHQDVGGGSGEDWNRNRYAEGCYNDGGAWGGTRCPSNSGWAWVTGEQVYGRFSDIHYLTIDID